MIKNHDAYIITVRLVMFDLSVYIIRTAQTVKLLHIGKPAPIGVC